jgi:starch synthase
MGKGNLMIGFWKYLIPRPRVLFATSELAPLIKTGGLADVSAGLPAALAELGCDIRVVMPGYGAVLGDVAGGRTLHRIRLEPYDVQIVETVTASGLPLLLVCCAPLFGRAGDPYLDAAGRDWHDNADRFELLARAIVWLSMHDPAWRPNVLHLNDWQTALAGALLAPSRDRPAIVFGIHNLSYQGLFDHETFHRLRLPPALWSYEALEFHGRLSFIKGGLAFADALVTVSPTYAREIQTTEFGCGLDGLLRHRSDRLHGILNGIDTRLWDPATDPHIAARYDVERLDTKVRNKTALQRQLGLTPGPQPLFAMIARLVPQKGIDLVLEAVPALLDLEAQLVVLGSGDANWQQALLDTAARHPGRIVYDCSRNERLAHLIEAGADLFLMPSRFEPCGLNQMYSMRYGTVPIARRTGGLADTVTPVHDGLARGTGFLFDDPTSPALVSAVREALHFYRKPEAWRRIQTNGMLCNFSWHASAESYLMLYRDLLTSAEMANLNPDGHPEPHADS